MGRRHREEALVRVGAARLPAPGTPGTPRYWQDETSGVLAAAIRSYLDNPDAMTVREIAYVRAYFQQWVDSPVWDLNPAHDEQSRATLGALRIAARAIRNGAAIARWLRAAEEIGMDPL